MKKTYAKLLSLAIVGCGLAAAVPAKADTVYHTVYHTKAAAGDPFSVLDKYQNNVLTANEYNNGAMSVPISAVDSNRDGFVTRREFYAYYRAPVPENAQDLNLIMPAAGGSDYDLYKDDQCVPQY